MRKEFKKIRDGVLDKKLKSQLIADFLVPNLKNPFALYYPIQSEVDLLSIGQEAYFPKINNQSIFFYQGPCVEKNDFGIFEPSTENLIESTQLQTVVVPGLAFCTTTGHRVGYGKGYYDRFLSHFLGLKIGVCFEEQVHPLNPKPYDVPMDIIITDKGVYFIT